MNNAIIMIFTLINIFSDLIEFTYDAGVFTRRHVLPALVWVYCKAEQGYHSLTEMNYTLRVYNTPMTTGLAY